MQRVRPIKIFDVALYVDAYKYYNINKKQYVLGPAHCQVMGLLYNNAHCMHCHIKGDCHTLYNWNFMLR